MSQLPATILIPLRAQVDPLLEQCVRSAIDQTVPAEVLVVSSAETPSSNLAVLERLAPEAGERMRIVRRDHPGFAAALNYGFQSASADRVGILLSDDWLEPKTIERVLAIDADIVSGGKLIWSDDGSGSPELLFEVVRSSAELERLTTLEQRARYITHFLFFRRQLVIDVGGVDESLGDLSGVDDYDLVWTLLERGASVGFTDEPHYNYRDHTGIRLSLRGADEQMVSLRRILDKHGLTAEEQERVVPHHKPWYGRRITDVLADGVTDE